MGIVVKDEVVVNLQGTDINKIEREIKAGIQETGKRLLLQALELIESQTLLKRKKCDCSKRNWRNRGRITRQIKTIAGTVSYRRVRLKCRYCGKERYPLDEALNLRENSNMSLGLIEQSLYLATDTAYDRASANLEKLTGIKISGRQIQNLAKEEGQRLKEKIRKEHEEIFDKAKQPEAQENRQRVLSTPHCQDQFFNSVPKLCIVL